ncbi:LOW QUALITY PROTEIN: zinc finger CCCH-type with G patch domain-containing protein-like [Trichechus inunguis]
MNGVLIIQDGQLQGDLKQLIGLTEASLVSVRKSKLLATLVQEHPAQENTECLAFQKAISEVVEVPAAPGAELETSKGEAAPEPNKPRQQEKEGEKEDDNEEELSGTKMNAPITARGGTLEYHNAMITGTEQAEDGSAAVWVLYLYPTHKFLKPCPFFPEWKCCFKENCRFSHGQVVSVDELRPFQDPDLSSLQAGSACLAKHQDGLWHPARITDVDSGFYTIKFDSLLWKEVVVEEDSVLILLRMEPVESSDSDGSDVDDSSYSRALDARASADWTCSGAFARWEVHTRIISSKLLAKVGYEPGNSPGQNVQGQVEPIHTVVLPRGKSLDQCAEALQRRVRGGKAGTHRLPKCREKRGTPAGRPSPRDVFDFLNEQLQAGAQRSKEAYHASKSTKRALTLRLVQAKEQIRQTQRDIRGTQEALTCINGRPSVAAAELQEKLAGAPRQQGQLQAQEARLHREQKKVDTHKKMTEL